ncbi:MAG: hypothetical protein WDZ93_00160 [Candidatus Paceibacterota bacterium]
MIVCQESLNELNAALQTVYKIAKKDLLADDVPLLPSADAIEELINTHPIEHRRAIANAALLVLVGSGMRARYNNDIVRKAAIAPINGDFSPFGVELYEELLHDHEAML